MDSCGTPAGGGPFVPNVTCLTVYGNCKLTGISDADSLACHGWAVELGMKRSLRAVAMWHGKLPQGVRS